MGQARLCGRSCLLGGLCSLGALARSFLARSVDMAVAPLFMGTCGNHCDGFLLWLVGMAGVVRSGSAAVSRKELVRRSRALTEKQMLYVLWASVAPEFRDPNTVKGFAESVGVSTVIVHRWAKDPRVVDAVRMLVLANASDPARVSHVLDFLFDTVNDVQAPLRDRLAAAKQWLDTTGVSGTYRRENDLVAAQASTEIDLAGLSDAEVAALYEERTGSPVAVGRGSDGSLEYLQDLGGSGVIEVVEAG